MASHMPERWADVMNTKLTPKVMDWHARMSARAGVKAALAMPNPVRDTLEAARRSMAGS
jgi:hypothetical protein